MDESLLRAGLPISAALDSLRDLATQVDNVVSGYGSDLGNLLRNYLAWIEVAEAQLRNLFRSSTVWQGLYTDRYWHLRDLFGGSDLRGVPLITNEAWWQRDRLTSIRDQLQQSAKALVLPDACLAAIPDTNIFMHYQFYDQIDWPKELGAMSVRLVVPLIVIDELDDLSFRSRPNSERAGRVIRSLQQLRGDKPPTLPIDVRHGVELQLLLDPAGHPRRPNDDDEILSRAEYLTAFVGQERVCVVAGDYGMRLRGSARGLRCTQLGDQLRIR